ncbi:DsbA family protein [Patescibacteria group bacterium]
MEEDNKTEDTTVIENDSGSLDENQDAETGKDKKIKNLVSIAILVGGLFLGSVFVDVAQLVKGGGYSEGALSKTDVFSSVGKTWVAYADPIVKIEVLTDEDCESCDPGETLVLLRRILPTISVSKIDQNSEEGVKLLEEANIKTLPAFVFSKEIKETEFFLQTEQLFDPVGDKFILKTTEAGIKAGKYIDLPTVGENDIKIGPDDAKVKVIEYSDFQCPFCNKFHPEVIKVLDEYGDKIQYVYKHLPLAFHLQAENAALASECANEQDKFLPYADRLFTDQEAWGKTEGTQTFKTMARQVGIDVAQFNECLDSKKYQDKINSDKEEAANFGVSGTPGTFINDQFQGGAINFETLKTIIDEELEK